METIIISPEEALGRCSWCGHEIPENTPVYGFGGKKRSGIDLPEYEGKAIRITLVTQKRTVICMVSAADSPAKRDGYDFMFMTCSDNCASEMKSVMNEEVSLGDALFKNLKEIRIRN